MRQRDKEDKQRLQRFVCFQGKHFLRHVQSMSYFIELVTFGRSIPHLILGDAICPIFSQFNPSAQLPLRHVPMLTNSTNPRPYLHDVMIPPFANKCDLQYSHYLLL